MSTFPLGQQPQEGRGRADRRAALPLPLHHLGRCERSRGGPAAQRPPRPVGRDRAAESAGSRRSTVCSALGGMIERTGFG